MLEVCFITEYRNVTVSSFIFLPFFIVQLNQRHALSSLLILQLPWSFLYFLTFLLLWLSLSLYHTVFCSNPLVLLLYCHLFKPPYAMWLLASCQKVLELNIHAHLLFFLTWGAIFTSLLFQRWNYSLISVHSGIKTSEKNGFKRFRAEHKQCSNTGADPLTLIA